jgi:type I restriction enzyme S subunit
MSEIAALWGTAQLGELCSITTGDKDVNEGNPSGEFPFFTCAQEISKSNSYSFDGEAILIAGNGNFSVKKYKGKFEAYQRTYVLQNFKISPAYLYYFISHRLSEITKDNRGSTIRYIRIGNLTDYNVTFPCEQAQHRIVAKIEELFSELDKGIENLKTAQAQLKVYRQALLKHAFEGKLTAQWREERRTNNSVTPAKAGVHADEKLDSRLRGNDEIGDGGDVISGGNDEPLETADTLLKRIQQARAQRYQQQLADWQANGKQGSLVQRAGKPKAPKSLPPLTAEELAELPELPEGWGWCKLGDFIDSIDAGKSFKCDEREPRADEIGVAKVSAVTWGEYDESESKTCTDTSKENEAYLIRVGDFILSRANTIDLVGVCVIARKVTKKIMLSDKTLRIRFDGFSQEYFLQYLGSRGGRKQIMLLSTGNQESMRNIGQERIRSITVPICSAAEADVVIESLAAKLSEADQLDQTLTASLQQAEALRQSILKKAFSGQLVPQDPHDEPASGLLARIRAEKMQHIERSKKSILRSKRNE